MRYLLAIFGLLLLFKATTAQEQLSGTLLFSSNKSGYFEIYRLDLDTKEVFALTNRRSSMPDYAPVLSSTGEWLTFVSYRRSGWRSWVMKLDGSAARFASRYNNYNGFARFSPDEKELVFNASRPGYALYLADADGGNVRKLLENSNYDALPSWSADGKSVLFCSRRKGAFQIFQVDKNGSHLRQLTSGRHDKVAPVQSPDGSKMVYCAWLGRVPEIFVANADGSAPKQLTQHAEERPDFPAYSANDMVSTWYTLNASWSPDGAWIVYSGLAGEAVELFAIRPDGSDRRQLTFDGAFASYPSWGATAR